MGTARPTDPILVVDDERGVRALCTDILTRAGYETEAADSALAALGRLDERDYSLILMDIHMPVMDGVELCRRIRQRRPDQPVVLITGCPSIDTAVRGIRNGASDYLAKPFTPETLRETVARVLAQAA
jgi:DNA-binding NtrC family response regulator